jgi:hypothetical protein
MKNSQLIKSRFIVGIVVVVVAVLMFLVGDYSPAGVTAILILGLTSIAISRRR